MYIKVSNSSPNKSIFEEKFHGQYHFFYFTMKVCGSGCNAASGNLWTMKEIYAVAFNESCLLITVGTVLMNHEMSDHMLG